MELGAGKQHGAMTSVHPSAQNLVPERVRPCLIAEIGLLPPVSQNGYST
jgi:hypothetical protein